VTERTFRTVAEIAEYHRAQQRGCEEAAAVSEWGYRVGCEDAFFHAKGWRKQAAQHEQMAITLESIMKDGEKAAPEPRNKMNPEPTSKPQTPLGKSTESDVARYVSATVTGAAKPK
jgi:hypothetical protein